MLGRLLVFILMAGWLLFNPRPIQSGNTHAWVLLVVFAAHLAVFHYLSRRAILAQPTLYKISLIFDVILVTAFIHVTGGFYSDFYLLYYLVISFSVYYLGLRGILSCGPA